MEDAFFPRISFIFVMYFRVSERQISVYNAQKLSAPLKTTSLDVSPSILIPFYDEDSSTLFVTGKGDSTIYCYEITDEEPYICPLSHHRCTSLHQGLSFLTKNHCDVASVEFSKAYRLTNTTIEPLSFTVPRIKVRISYFMGLGMLFCYSHVHCRVSSSKTIYSHPPASPGAPQ